MLFGRKKPRLTLQQQLAARPVRLVDGELAEREDGGVNLVVTLRQTRWSGWFFRMPEGAKKTFELDEMGRLVWDNCDGKTSVQQIIRRISKGYNLNLREAQVATVQFLNMLTKKGLIGMALREAPGKGK